MAGETTTRAIRRGLPRVRGGAPWPPAADVEVAVAVRDAPAVERGAVTDAPTAVPAEAAAPAAPVAAQLAASPQPAAPVGGAPTRIRRGLPRVAGGAPWPEVEQAALPVAAAVAVTATAASVAAAAPVAAAPVAAPAPAATTAAPTAAPAAPTPSVAPEPTPAATSAPAPAQSATAPAAAPAKPPVRAAPAQASARPATTPKPEPRRYRGLTVTQWVWRSIGGAAAIVAFAGLVMLAARGLLTFTWASDFVHRYPGVYKLPAAAPVGFPLWLEWQHFLNAFFMLLIIRTGIQIRGERKPPANWSPRWNSTRRISLTVWLHQSLDLLWFANGVVFVVALFSTGQWLRVVPSSWSVFPNAVSAGLQYASLNWPDVDGWANYNSLQQLSYFAVIFLLAPLAAITGIRMSGLWNKKWERASKLYPLPLARAIHFPTMIAFCVFIVIHITLVLATGALRNLNHMYGHSDVVNWAGFWFFVGALLVMAGGWVAARPLVTAPIASLFGKVGR